MPFHRQGKLVSRQTMAIIGHEDAGEATAVGLDLYVPGASVEGVLHQFLDRAGRALHHLAGGDAVDQFGREAMDGHDAST